MHLALVVLASTTTTTKPSTASAGSSATGLILIVILGLAAYFLFIRPRSMAQRRQRETLQEIGPGDEILTGSGIFGTVLDVASDRITIETAPGTRITVLRSTVARRIVPETDSSGEDSAEHDWSDDAGSHDPDSSTHESGALGWSTADDAEGHNGSQGGGGTDDDGHEHEEEGRP